GEHVHTENARPALPGLAEVAADRAADASACERHVRLRGIAVRLDVQQEVVLLQRVIRPSRRWTKDAAILASLNFWIADRISNLNAGVIKDVHALHNGVAANGRLEDGAELVDFRARQIAEDLSYDDAEATVLKLPLVDLLDHVASELLGERL